MTIRQTFVFFLLAGFVIATAEAQETPSMNPEEQRSGSGIGAFAGLGNDRPKDARTEITATKEATFDNAASTAEFVGRVVVRDPQFTLTCDRLKVTLSKDRKGLERAEATGNVVIIQETTDNSGQTTKAIGRAGQAVYTPATGDIVLSIWPQVQQGVNNQVATEESTVMTLNRSGRSVTKGSSKTMITDGSGS